MKIYVLTYEPYHDKSEIVGAYASIELAMKAAERVVPSAWQREGFYVGHDAHPHVVAQAAIVGGYYEDALIMEFEVPVNSGV